METFFREAFSTRYMMFAVFLLVGAVELIVLYFIYRYRKRIKDNGHETTGTVVKLVKGTGGKTGTRYHPVFQYRTHMNETITQKSKMASNPPFYKEGAEVTIFYNPQKPQQFVIRDDKRFRLLYLIMGGVAGIFFLVGLIGLFPLFKLSV
jgi:hypothetical protein